MKENETNVAPEGTSPEPAKTAENETIVSSPGVPPAGPRELPQETNVSIIAVVRGYLAEHPIEEWLEPKLEALKAEILAKVAELVTPVVAKSAEAARPIEPPIEHRTGPTRGVMLDDQAPEEQEHELAVGDPVKVWADAAHKNFHLGVIESVHDGGAYNVKLEGGGTTYIRAAGLEFDDRR